MWLRLRRHISSCITLLYPKPYDLKKQYLPPLTQHTMVSGEWMTMKDNPTKKGRNGSATAVTILGVCCQVPPNLGAGHFLQIGSGSTPRKWLSESLISLVFHSALKDLDSTL